MTFRERYDAERAKSSPARIFIRDIAKATVREEATVRQWLSGIQEPTPRVKEIIAEVLGASVDELFPPKSE